MNKTLKFTPEELYRYIKNNINYGFVDNKGRKYFSNDFKNVNIDSLYVLQSPTQTLNNKCAWCWDVVELLRYYMEQNNLYNETYYMEYKNNNINAHNTHTFILFKQNNKWYNIEDNSSNNESGIFEYNTKEELILEITNSFKNWIKLSYNLESVEDFFICNKYAKPPYGIGANEFQNFCKNQE